MNRSHVIHRIEEIFLVILVIALLVLTCGQIILRNMFSITFLGTENIVRHLVLWIGLFGALLSTRLDKHIRIDALLRLMPIRVRALVLACADILTAMICGLLSFIAWRFVSDEREYGGTAFFDVPAWLAQLCFPLVFGLMALRFFCISWQKFTQRTTSSQQ